MMLMGFPPFSTKRKPTRSVKVTHKAEGYQHPAKDILGLREVVISYWRQISTRRDTDCPEMLLLVTAKIHFLLGILCILRIELVFAMSYPGGLPLFGSLRCKSDHAMLCLRLPDLEAL